LDSEHEKDRSDIVAATDLGESAVRRCLNNLRLAGIVEEVSKSSFVISPPFTEFIPDPGIELWAFEVKIEDWVQAFYQAMRYQSFAHRVWIVIPEEVVHRAARHAKRLRRFRVGLIAVDSNQARIRTLVQAPEHTPSSAAHYLFAVSTFLRKVHGAP